jgi:hypothetical protein
MRHCDAQGYRNAPGLAHPSDSPGEPCLTTPKREVRSSPW